MDFTVESTPHQDARAYMSAYEGGEVMQDFEMEDADDTATQKDTEKKQKDMGFLLRSEGEFCCPKKTWPRDLEAEAREMALIIQKRKPTYKRPGQGELWDQYGESSSATSSEAHVMSEKANVESNGAHGRRMSQAIRTRSLLSHTDFNRPTRVMANRQSGLATSDSRSLISGTLVPPDGIRLLATSAPGSMKAIFWKRTDNGHSHLHHQHTGGPE